MWAKARRHPTETSMSKKSESQRVIPIAGIIRWLSLLSGSLFGEHVGRTADVAVGSVDGDTFGLLARHAHLDRATVEGEVTLDLDATAFGFIGLSLVVGCARDVHLYEGGRFRQL